MFRRLTLRPRSRAFTLIELLAVITIVLIVSVLALPAIKSGLDQRQIGESARIVQAALAGARDAAIRTNAPAGIRLVPDPTVANCCGRIIPLSSPPDYADGAANVFPGEAYPAAVLGGTQALVLEESPGNWVPIGNGKYAWIVTNPVSWAWNVRQGDRIQINRAGPWYAVVGPIVMANDDRFVNVGSPGTGSPLSRTFTSPDGQTVEVKIDFLLLCNGVDDDGNGWIDEGFDGVDNNVAYELAHLLPALTDDTLEWEAETWRGSLGGGINAASYTIKRRPWPGIGSREVSLPAKVVIDLNRSKLPGNILDIIVGPDGSISPAIPYASRASLSLDAAFIQLWLAERADVGMATPTGLSWLISASCRTGRVSSFEQPDLVEGYSRARQGGF